MIRRLQHALWRLWGEERLVVAFWPQDFPVGSAIVVSWGTFRITRYERCPDGQYYDVWGRKAVRP